MDRRTLDQLVTSITRELANEQPWTGPAVPPVPTGGRARGGFHLIDNWRVRADHREQFLAFYTRHVADVIKQVGGYVDGRVLVAPIASPYSWHVHALYEFADDSILDRFQGEFDRMVRRTDASLSLEKVLDALDPWVLGHEDGTLSEVWR